MAKKRTSKQRRYFSKSKKRSSKRKGGLMATLLSAAIYGAAREKVSVKISPMTSKIPAGNIADEVGMLLVGYGVKKFVGSKVPMLSDAAKAGMYIEAARIGEAIAKGQLGNLGTGATQSDEMIF